MVGTAGASAVQGRLQQQICNENFIEFCCVSSLEQQSSKVMTILYILRCAYKIGHLVMNEEYMAMYRKNRKPFTVIYISNEN